MLFHAYHLPVEFQQLEGAYLPPDFWANVKAEAEETLDRYAEDLRKRGVEVEAVVAEGYAATAIVDEVEKQNADLVVIGTHGLSGLKHLLLGSIAERVVQKAPCPVLTVKRPVRSSVQVASHHSSPVHLRLCEIREPSSSTRRYACQRELSRGASRQSRCAPRRRGVVGIHESPGLRRAAARRTPGKRRSPSNRDLRASRRSRSS